MRRGLYPDAGGLVHGWDGGRPVHGGGLRPQRQVPGLGRPTRHGTGCRLLRQPRLHVPPTHHSPRLRYPALPPKTVSVSYVFFSVADPGCLSRIRLFPSRIRTKKWFLSSRKYDPGFSSRIRMLTFYPSRISDPGVKKAPDPGSATLFFLSWCGIESTICVDLPFNIF